MDNIGSENTEKDFFISTMGSSEKQLLNKKPLLSIVIPVLNSLQFYKTCLNSLLKSSYTNIEIIVVDDGSTDGSLEKIVAMAQKHSRLKVVRSLTKYGIPRSRNIGIEFCSGDLVAFLDIDMEIGQGWPEEIIKILQNNLDIGGVVPKVLDFQQRDIIQATGIHIIPHTCWAIGIGYGEKDVGQFDKDKNISIGAAGSIFRKNVLRQLEGFDETLGMFDDIDIGWRTLLLGWRTYYTHKAVIYHYTSKSWSQRPKTSYRLGLEFYIDNLIRPLIKNLELKSLLYYLPQSLLIMLIRIIKGVLTLNFIPLKGAIQALSWNIIHLKETLSERKRVQKTRLISDSQLIDNFFIKGNIIQIYFKYLRPALTLSKVWAKTGTRTFSDK